MYTVCVLEEKPNEIERVTSRVYSCFIVDNYNLSNESVEFRGRRKSRTKEVIRRTFDDTQHRVSISCFVLIRRFPCHVVAYRHCS